MRLVRHNFKPCCLFPSLIAVQKLRCLWVFVPFYLAVVQYCFYELSRNRRKYVLLATPCCIYHLLVLPPAEWGYSHTFSTAVITSPLTFFLLGLRNSLNSVMAFSPHPPFLLSGPRNRYFPPPPLMDMKAGKKWALFHQFPPSAGWGRSGLDEKVEKGNKKGTRPRQAERDCTSRGLLYIIKSIAQ